MKYQFQRLLLAAALAMLLHAAFAAPKPKKELFVPMDYSTCGYRGADVPLPVVANVVFVEWSPGDCHSRLQLAIDYVSGLKADAEGRRGAVLLGPGRFVVGRPLRISASGVVVRGSGPQSTVLAMSGVERGAAIYVEGSPIRVVSDTLRLSSDNVAAGSCDLQLAAGHALAAGDAVRIVRPCTAEWISHLGMDDFGGGLDYTGWKPTDVEMEWERTVMAASDGRITLDAPLTTALSEAFGGAFVMKTDRRGELRECGIENLCIDAFADQGPDRSLADEDHCWDGIWMEHASDCWVRRVRFVHLAGSAVNLQKHVRRVTVEDCMAVQPVSEIGGWRRQVFLTRGQQTLFQRCLSRQGIHDFAAGYCAAGPNAFVQCEGEQSLGFSGSIGSWAPGLLFDIVNIDGGDLAFRNLEQFQFGTGWNTANSMFWQCTASTIWCYSPDGDNRCSGHGCWATLTGNGEWTSSNDHVQPRSLYYSQLAARRPDGGTPAPHLLPMNTAASSSPAPEEAALMARQSLTVPRLTLEMWLDSIPYEASTDPSGLKRLKDVPRVENGPMQPRFAVSGGWLTAGGRLITGNRYDIPWWSGRVKDNFVAQGARPAVTRFVPGREGTGWTDRLDSVVDYLKSHHFAMLDHNYGLWYDLRRTDHERVRRADGDVWAPFYEQPFARSGQGTAWDGLSRYDLAQPNRWYWQRLRSFADKAAVEGILLFNHHYFQHNILEAGAHWVDCPWRPVNNLQHTPFPEPVPFTGDKRIFMAEQFYDIRNDSLRDLHRQYIRQCLDEVKDQSNAVHLLSAEYTGPLHFTRFWLQTIAEWEAETGRHPLVALSCTKDAQDSILADPSLARVVDIIDIRYWHYNTDGLWAPPAGGNLAPRQWMRKMKVGKTGWREAWQAVDEYTRRFPDKAVTFFSQQYPSLGWAILMGGGSLPNVNIADTRLLADLPKMRPVDGKGCAALGNSDVGYLLYVLDSQASIDIAPGKYDIYNVEKSNGSVVLKKKKASLAGIYGLADAAEGTVVWLQKK